MFVFAIETGAADASATQLSLEVLYDNAYPPYMYGDFDSVKGLYPTLIENIFDNSNIAISHNGLPWKRALLIANSENVAVAGVFPNEERRKAFYFSDPIYDEKLVVFAKRDSRLIFTSAEDLIGKSLGLVRGYTYGEEFDKLVESQLVEVSFAPDNATNFKKLVLGRVDFVVAEKNSAAKLIEELGFGSSIKSFDTPFYQSSGYLVVGKNSNVTDMIPVFNRLMAKSKKTGEFERWVNTFFEKKK